MMMTTLLALALTAGAPDAARDAEAVAALDTQYHAAVEKNDVEGMARILHPEMVVVTGRGQVYTRQIYWLSTGDTCGTYAPPTPLVAWTIGPAIDPSTSASVVDHAITLTRIAVTPCHTVGPHQHVPSS